MSRRRDHKQAIAVIKSLKRKNVVEECFAVADSSLSEDESNQINFQHERSEVNFGENVNFQHERSVLNFKKMLMLIKLI